MVFSSIVFLFYFLPLFFLFYYLADKKYKNAVILIGSIFFYSWGAPRFIFVILGTTVVDFYVVRKMASSTQKALRTALLCLSLSINLGLLFYFKYSYFTVENINHVSALFGIKSIVWVKVILPLGISFYTFETLTYVIDVYNELHEPLKKFWDYQMYIILFPKLIAGPIIRYNDFADQIYDHADHETSENSLRGLYRFGIGLGKKALIANAMGAAADTIFDIPYEHLGTATAWFGAISYTFQMYFDFSGYSDMAIGLGLMMGFRFPENFNNPFCARSLTEFWQKWHITLGKWLYSYLFVPMGIQLYHSRRLNWIHEHLYLPVVGRDSDTKLRVYFNLWFLFVVCGLWHGAAWGFIIWGAYHGVFIVLEQMFLGKWLQKLGKFAALYTFIVVTIGLVFFKIEYFHPALGFLKKMFTLNADTNSWKPDNIYFTTLAFAIFFTFFALSKLGERIQQKIFYANYSLRLHYLMASIFVVLFIMSAARISTASFNPFIYFRF